MFKIVKKEINWNGNVITLETGKIARQASGAVIVRMGDTVVLAAVVGDKKVREGIDFFPLTVNYITKFYAAGRIPGGYRKREGNLGEDEVLVSRLIDRPIRPMFPEGFFNEVNITCTVLSYDPSHEPDILALIASSAALYISGIPFLEPVAAARVGMIDGEFVLNPSLQQLEESAMDLVVAGTESSVLMVESEAKELSEAKMLEAVMYGHQQFQVIIEAIKQFAAEVGNAKWEVNLFDNSAEKTKAKELAAKKIISAYAISDKQTRRDTLSALKEEVVKSLVSEQELDAHKVVTAFKDLEKDLVRSQILDKKTRIDGRTSVDIRPIVCETGLLPKTHGSALFTRGETQAICVTTLGTGEDEQKVETLAGASQQRFMLHYNFPPYSVGEVGALRAPGRREIGHGKLAWRALQAVLPSKEAFPYAIRVVADITESNGSSSMASVCGASLTLQDAGVPISEPVAGIAMGLIKEGEKFVVLSDIMGDEDHLGDMDFKVAGTTKGITALQMDIKINGINEEIMRIALAQAKDGREHILGKMAEVISESRSELSANAPQIHTIKIDKDKIREVIGSGGKVIRDICEKSNAKVDIAEDGTISVAAVGSENIEIALKMIRDIVVEPEIGKIYNGVVTRLFDFGALVRFLGAREGMVHISEISTERVEKVSDVLSEGKEVQVKLLEIDNRSGKIKLTMNLDATPRPTEDRKGSERRGGDRRDDRNKKRSPVRKEHNNDDHHERGKNEVNVAAEPKKKRFF